MSYEETETKLRKEVDTALNDVKSYRDFREKWTLAQEKAGSLTPESLILANLFSQKLHERIETDAAFAADAFRSEMNDREYGYSTDDYDVCEQFFFNNDSDGHVERIPDGTGSDYLKEAGYSDGVCRLFESEKQKFLSDFDACHSQDFAP